MTKMTVTIESSGVIYELTGEYEAGHQATRDDPGDPCEYWVEEVYLIPASTLRVPPGSPNLISLIEAIDGGDMLDNLFYEELMKASDVNDAAARYAGGEEE